MIPRFQGVVHAHQPLEGDKRMTDTTRRVAVTLIAATDEPAHQVMAGVLDAVRNALPGLDIDYTTNSAFDLAENDAEPSVQIAVDAKGGITGTWVDNPNRADEFARNTGAVVVSLPIEIDHRPEEASRDDR